jgi:primosomal protein N' (replication factor Y)
MRMVRGEVDLVIGARSALFAPLPRLGMIIVDEEHDSSYKQEAALRYQARDAAVMRGKLENSLVVLGSGTPSVQSFQNSLNGRYRLLRMPERVEQRPLPDIEIVDMKNTDKNGSAERMISPQLRKALQENLAGRRQSILFLNRRGFHRLFICRSCGETLGCPNCEISLTYHQAEDRLICHYCGYYSRPQADCAQCGCAELKSYGFGTEKLEHELKADFPSARIARMDTDITRSRQQPFQILKRFSEHELDLLVGTQMITKGYDFPKVTLVGVIAADQSLDFPDFRAAERTFQLLSQVAGRAGRGAEKGRVIIQTFNPAHYAIRSATAHDYHGFFEKESGLRKQLGYPPYSFLACLRLKGNSKERTAEAVQRLGSDMRAVLSGWPRRGQEIQILGPVEAPVPRLKGKYRWQILVRSRNTALLKYFLSHIEQQARKTLRSSGVQLIVDVDPYQMN